MSKIKEQRENNRLTQAQLAERANVSRAHIAKIESGKFEPNTRTIRKLAKALGAEPRDLI